MLDGITILETITSRKVPLAVPVIMSVLAVVLTGLLISCWIRAARGKGDMYHWGDFPAIVAWLTELVVIVAMCIGTFSMWEQYNTFETKYRVSINESVSMIEFNEKYEIIEQDGNEYIIEEKTDN